MAKKSKFNQTVINPKTGAISTFEKDVVYPDSAVTADVNENDFITVQDDAIDSGEEAPKKSSKKGKKVEGELE